MSDTQEPQNISYDFLQSLSEKRNKKGELFKFIISFLLSPLRIIRDFLVFNYDTTVLKSGLFLPIISIILIVGFLLIVKESPTHLFNAIIKTDSLLLRFSFIAWPFLCVFLNLLTLALIELFAQPYKHSTA